MLDSTLVVVVPVVSIQLEVLASVVDVPVIVEPARLPKPILKVAKDGL